MKWKVVARPEAKHEVLQAANWYDRQSVGLGDEFMRIRSPVESKTFFTSGFCFTFSQVASTISL